MSDAIQLKNLTPQQRRELMAQLMAAEAQEQLHPASCTQERLWFLDRFAPGTATYTMVTTVRLTGPLSLEALQQSIHALVQRHESLRTIFKEENDRPVQIVRERMDVPVVLVDLSEHSEAAANQQAMQFIERQVREPFDLAQGPLFRVHLIRLAPQEHLLLLCIHHIIGDGWSNGILCDEWCTLYNDAKAGRISNLAPLPVQFADYALWERQRLERGELDGQIEQWKQLLAGAPALLELPTDRPRPQAESHRGQRLRFQMNPALVDGLKKLARSEGGTLYMAMLSIFNILLFRHSGQSDIVVGTPVANRNRSEIEGVVGFFANTLPMRVRFEPQQNIRNIIRLVREAALSLYATSEVPFERLVQELRPARNLSHAPIFQVMFSYDSTPARHWNLDGIEARIIKIDTGTSKFDLMFHFEDSPQEMNGSLEFNTDLFNLDSAQRMVQHFLALASAAIETPEQPIASLPMLQPLERDQVVNQFNATQVDFGRESQQCLHTLFEAQADRTPLAVALRFEDRQVTYAQLNERADAVATLLQAAGVGPDVLVGVFMDRSIEMVVALLATLKSGGAYVPIDPSYPANRIAFMLQDSSAALLLTQPHLAQQLPMYRGQVICLNVDGIVNSARPMEGARAPQSRAASDNNCYVIYTSGSTGRPKGVAIPHRAIVNHMLWMRSEFPLTADDRVLQKTPTSFDASVWEFYAPLISGAQLVMAAPDIHRSPGELIQAVIDHRITTLQLVPTMLEAMLEQPQLHQCVSLKRVFCGGEALTSHLTRRLRAALPGVEIINLYGPTEASIDATFWRCTVSEEALTTQPIGRPIANMQAYILSAQMQPQPIGVPGELHLSGSGLARGYLNQPSLTAERFIQNPFREQPDDRLYKTGDLARYRADGVIEYLGRVDHQVKLRGHRIELGEIETVIARQPGIAACVVVVRHDDPANPLLTAYLVRSPGAGTDDAALRHAARQDLPDYMTPAAFVWLDEFPRLPSGKIDRASLPPPQRSSETTTIDEPRNPLEEALVTIWRQVLKIDRVGIHEGFFDLGGHSLMAAQIISRIRAVHGVELPLRAIFESPTVAGLALAMQQVPKNAAAVGPIKRITRARQLPAADLQRNGTNLT